MNKRQRIKKDKEFQLVFKKGKSFANRQFVVYCYRKERQAEFRIGLSVSKKIGNAVTRNRIKRYIRQSFLEMKDEVQNEWIILLLQGIRLPQKIFMKRKRVCNMFYDCTCCKEK